MHHPNVKPGDISAFYLYLSDLEKEVSDASST